ncbi:MAG: hypothetical protein FD153_406 [Rhodospirillaceae bacterium]|nr:MAG: hypothetical protein FD153_406 [Rhodospirillaceae bacterium]
MVGAICWIRRRIPSICGSELISSFLARESMASIRRLSVRAVTNDDQPQCFCPSRGDLRTTEFKHANPVVDPDVSLKPHVTVSLAVTDPANRLIKVKRTGI